MKTQLHHFAYNIKPNTLELLLELFEILGCALSYREKDARWCMVKQGEIPINIQIIETKDRVILIEEKINTHIAFLSDTPQENIKEIKQWAQNKNIEFREGAWSNQELWFDLPDIFINFVIEIMHSSVVE